MSPKRRMESEANPAAEGERNPVAETASTLVRDVRERLDVDRWIDRATELVHERPGLTLGIAVGVGVVLGATMFSRLGRMVLAGAIGVGAEVLVLRARASYADGRAH